MPKLEDIPFARHNTMRRAAKGKHEAQYKRTIVGKTVGRVPANLGEVLRKLEDNCQQLEVVKKIIFILYSYCSGI